MKFIVFLQLVSLLLCGSVRIPLAYDNQSPFLHHSANNKNGNSFNHESLISFSWSNVFLGKLLHMSDIVEIGPRGVRFIFEGGALHNKAKNGLISSSKYCRPTELALCQVQSNEGWIIPSEGKWGALFSFNIISNSSLLKDDVMRVFAEETSCHREGQGGNRVYTSKVIEYSITSCDILYGDYLIVYYKGDERVDVYPHSFGPIAYLLILISATVSTTAIAFLSKSSETELEDKKVKQPEVVVIIDAALENTDHKLIMMTRYIPFVFNINAFISTLVCFIIFMRSKIHFHIEGDLLIFASGVISGLLYEFCILITTIYFNINNIQKQWIISMEIDGCVYALQTIAIAVYRTPENPYTCIMLFFMACRIWEKFFLLCHGLGREHKSLIHSKYIRYIDIILAVINFNLICELGMKQQYIFQDVWPLYFMLNIFISYCLVKYRWILVVTVF
jgi:hypothetical protein